MADFTDAQNEEYIEMSTNWQLIKDLNGGTRAMRDAGTQWLPMSEGEEQELGQRSYRKRLNRSVLYPFYSKGVSNLISKPLSTPISFQEDMPAVIQEDWKSNIDLQGNDIDTFARSFFKDALDSGLSHILVDYTKVEEPENVTLADSSTMRPYWVHIKAEQVIDWDSVYVNGTERLSMVRIAFNQWERIDGKKQLVYKYKEILADGTYTVWYWDEQDKEWYPNEDEAGQFTDKNGQPFDFIPLYTLYTNKTGFMTARPYLEDLAYLNQQHWVMTSDIANIINYANTPILFGKGLAPNVHIETDNQDNKPEITFGDGQMVTGPENSDMKFVEHTGQAIGTARDERRDLEVTMSRLALEPLRTERSGNVTATENAISHAEMSATLKSIVGIMENTFEEALRCFGIYTNLFDITDITSISINKDFGYNLDDATHMDAIFQAHQLNLLPAQNVLQEMKRRNMLADDLDVFKTLDIARTDSSMFPGLGDNNQSTQ